MLQWFRMVLSHLFNRGIEALHHAGQLLDSETFFTTKDCRHVDGADSSCFFCWCTVSRWRWRRSSSLGLLELFQCKLQDILQCRWNHHSLTLVMRPRLSTKGVDGTDGATILLDDNQVLVLHSVFADWIIVVNVHHWNENVSDEAEEALVQRHCWSPFLWRIGPSRMFAHGPGGCPHEELQVVSSCKSLCQIRPAIPHTSGFFEPDTRLLPRQRALRLSLEQAAIDEKMPPIIHANSVLACRQIQTHEGI
mmetsp:Transcript_53092/g.95206  ORF Transcript_53092/g.95206 Transcript_53092/m.95206 type:complete len:250 (-) Transcript_53092:911-1660(-)